MNRLPRLFAYMNSYSHGKSGGDMVFIEIAKRIVGFEIIVITSQLGRELCLKNQLNAQYIITTKEKTFGNIVFTYIKRTLKAILLRTKVLKNDILLGTSDFFPDVLPIFSTKLFIPRSIWIQHIFHVIPKNRIITHYAQRLSFIFVKRFADLIIVDNNLLKSELIQMGFDRVKIQVNYPGININVLNIIKPNSNTTYEGVFMAQLRESKGIFDLIKIWGIITKTIPNANLAIIGKGEQKNIEKINQMIQTYQLQKNIFLLGFLKDQEAFSLIKSSKLFIFPSHEEGFGIAPLEAQALGVPIVAYDLPVFSEIFPNGMIKIPIKDYKKFAASVIDLLRNKNKHKKLKIEAGQNAKRFNWDKTAEKEREIFSFFKI